MSPLTVVAKGLVGKVVHVFASGGHRFTGRLVKVAEDGQAMRLTNQPPADTTYRDGRGSGSDPTPIDFYIDLEHVVAISLKGQA